jgi:very-short-patch-repair endonuclease
LLLDRHLIRDLLLAFSQAGVHTSPVALSREEHLQRLLNLCQSDLERDWLKYVEVRGYRLPSKAQHLIESCHTRPDFLYEQEQVAIYVDGYHHLDDERQKRDVAQQDCLEDLGYIVLRFGVLNDWDQLFSQNRYIFGSEA